jgi:adenosylmethionine-8-amino-7-oxononanoate aminotransferase
VQARIATLATRQQALMARLAPLPGVRAPRTCGTIAAFDVEATDGGYLSNLAPRLMSYFRDAGVLLRPLGNTVYVLPPYCIDETDLARIGDVIEEALATIKS